MMQKILVILGCLMVAGAQDYRVRDSKNAKILQEARYLQGGNHGAAYVQDDGTEFKEETDADGTRKGSYSYIDDTGKKITVQYTAGKDGFMVSGDHLPKPPQPLPVAPQQSYQSQPPKQYNPSPQYNSIPQLPVSQGNHFSYNSPGQQFPQQPQFAAPLEPYRNDIGNNGFRDFSGNSYSGQFQQPQITEATQSPRYFPPGKLNLNRTPDGFQYSFSSN